MVVIIHLHFILYLNTLKKPPSGKKKLKKEASITLNCHQWNFAMAWREQSFDFRGSKANNGCYPSCLGMEPSDWSSFILEIKGHCKISLKMLHHPPAGLFAVNPAGRNIHQLQPWSRNCYCLRSSNKSYLQLLPEWDFSLSSFSFPWMKKAA